MDTFTSFHVKGRRLVIELFLDKFLDFQPRTEEEVETCTQKLIPDITSVNDICKRKELIQLIIVDLNNGLMYEKFNFTLFGKLVRNLLNEFPDNPHLKEIEIRNCHPMAKTIWDISKVLVPREITSMIKVFST